MNIIMQTNHTNVCLQREKVLLPFSRKDETSIQTQEHDRIEMLNRV